MGEIKKSIVIGFTVFIVYAILLLGGFYLINNLTTYTILISFSLGLFIGYLVVFMLNY